jgi:Rad3-related DNA helicase
MENKFSSSKKRVIEQVISKYISKTLYLTSRHKYNSLIFFSSHLEQSQIQNCIKKSLLSRGTSPPM